MPKRPSLVRCISDNPLEMTYQWCDELGTQEPAPKRRLTLPELRRLQKLGFGELATRLAAGTCRECGLNKHGQGHKDLCITPAERRDPVPAGEQPRQPWEPRISRHAA